MEVKLGLERRRILVLGGLKPPGHGDAGRNWAGGLSEAGAAWHVSRSEAKQCDSAPALLLLALPVLLCTHRGCPCHPSLPCVQTSLAARKQRALLPASDRFSAFGAELALVGDWVGGSPHSARRIFAPPPTPTSDQGVPVLHHPSASSDECCGCCRGHCTLDPREQAAAPASWRHRPKAN